MSEPELERLVDAVLDTVAGRVGLRVPTARRRAVGLALERVYRGSGAATPGAFLGRLAGEQPLEGAVLEELAVGETYFFRDERQLELVRGTVLPALARELGPERRLRAWSAGCSTGEEAWTLALLLGHALPGWALEVVGSDLLPARLERAQAGVYGERSLARVDPALRAAFFSPHPGGARIEPGRLPPVRFVPHNLLRDPPPPPARGVALAVCRNLLIYYEDPAQQAAIVGHLEQALQPGGWLVLGHAESLPPPLEARFQRVVGEGATVYRKLRPGEEPVRAPRAAAAAPLAPAPEPPPPRRPARPAPLAPLDPATELARRAFQRADEGDAAGAEEAARAALAAAPRAVPPRLLLVQLLEQRGALGAARTALEEGLYLAPEERALHAFAAAFYARAGHPLEAARHRARGQVLAVGPGEAST